MLPDLPKNRATQKSGAKDRQKDLAAPDPLQAPSKQGHRREETGQDRVRRRSGQDDSSPSRHP